DGGAGEGVTRRVSGPHPALSTWGRSGIGMRIEEPGREAPRRPSPVDALRAIGVGRWARLLAGLFVSALGSVLMIRSGLGLGPWDAFHVGMHLQTGLTVGAASIAVGVAIVIGLFLTG